MVGTHDELNIKDMFLWHRSVPVLVLFIFSNSTFHNNEISAKRQMVRYLNKMESYSSNKKKKMINNLYRNFQQNKHSHHIIQPGNLNETRSNINCIVVYNIFCPIYSRYQRFGLRHTLYIPNIRWKSLLCTYENVEC